MSRELTPNRAAKLLRVDRKTVYAWCHAALAGDEGSKLAGAVVQTPTGRLWVSSEAVRRLLPEGR